MLVCACVCMCEWSELARGHLQRLAKVKYTKRRGIYFCTSYAHLLSLAAMAATAARWHNTPTSNTHTKQQRTQHHINTLEHSSAKTFHFVRRKVNYKLRCSNAEAQLSAAQRSRRKANWAALNEESSRASESFLHTHTLVTTGNSTAEAFASLCSSVAACIWICRCCCFCCFTFKFVFFLTTLFAWRKCSRYGLLLMPHKTICLHVCMCVYKLSLTFEMTPTSLSLRPLHGE